MNRSSLMLIATFMLAGTTISAFGAEVSSCRNRVKETCYNRITPALSKIMNTAKDCKFVKTDDQGRENIAFTHTGAYRLTSVDVKECKVSDYTFQSGSVTDQKVFAGRLFVTISSKRVVMLGRNNELFELMNSSGVSYSNVTSLKVDSQKQTIILSHDNGQKTTLTMGQIQNRIDTNRIDPIARSY